MFTVEPPTASEEPHLMKFVTDVVFRPHQARPYRATHLHFVTMGPLLYILLFCRSLVSLLILLQTTIWISLFFNYFKIFLKFIVCML